MQPEDTIGGCVRASVGEYDGLVPRRQLGADHGSPVAHTAAAKAPFHASNHFSLLSPDLRRKAFSAAIT